MIYPALLYFISSYRCVLSKKEEAPQTYYIVRVEILPFGGVEESSQVKLTTHHQKKTWLNCVHFVLRCSKFHQNVSRHLWHTNYVTMYDLTSAGLHTFSVMFHLLLRAVEHTDIRVVNSGHAVLQWSHSAKLSVVMIINYQCYKFQNIPFCRTKLK